MYLKNQWQRASCKKYLYTQFILKSCVQVIDENLVHSVFRTLDCFFYWCEWCWPVVTVFHKPAVLQSRKHLLLTAQLCINHESFHQSTVCVCVVERLNCLSVHRGEAQTCSWKGIITTVTITHHRAVFPLQRAHVAQKPAVYYQTPPVHLLRCDGVFFSVPDSRPSYSAINAAEKRFSEVSTRHKPSATNLPRYSCMRPSMLRFFRYRLACSVCWSWLVELSESGSEFRCYLRDII